MKAMLGTACSMVEHMGCTDMGLNLSSAPDESVPSLGFCSRWRDERVVMGLAVGCLFWVTQEPLLQGWAPPPPASHTCQSPRVCLLHPAFHSL